MKREDLIDAMEYIDDELIREADQTRNAEESAMEPGKITPLRRRKASIRRWGMLAASFTIFVIAAFAVSGVIRTQNAAREAMNSAEAVRTEDTREDQEAYTPEDQADAYAPEEQTDAYASEEQTGAYAPEDQAAASAPEEQADAYAPEEQAEVYASEKQTGASASEEPDTAEDVKASAIGSVRIRVISDAGEICFVLNNTPAAESLAAQLPITADTELYSDNEIVFHPGEPLSVENGIEGGGTAGYIGYYAPWNNVVLYYGDFEEYPGLYILGEAVSGAENIKDIRGSITIELE